MDIELLPPIAHLTAEDKGPIVIVYTYILLINTIVLAIVKVTGTILMKQKFHGDDIIIFIATALALAQSVVTERSAIDGVGRYQQSLTLTQLDAYFKRAFISNILSFAVQSLAKASVVSLIQRISATVSSPITPRVLYTSVGGWFVFSTLALSFQCGTLRPWFYQPSQCVGEGAFWYPIIIGNVLTDMAIASFFAPVVWGLQIANRAKLRISGLFAARLIVCALSICHLVEMSDALRANDTTRAMQVPTVFGQFVMNFSIITAIAPSIYRFLNELHAGLGFGGIIEQAQYEMNDYAASAGRRTQNSNNTRKSSVKILFRPDISDGATVGITSQADRNDSSVTIDETDGRGSEDLIIRQTNAWTVESHRASSVGGVH